MRVHDRVLCLLRSRDERQDVSLGGLRGYFREVGRQLIGRDVGPGPVRRPAPEPPPRKENVVLLAGDLFEDIALGVTHVEEAGAIDRSVLGVTLRHDELRRLGRYDEDRRLRVFLFGLLGRRFRIGLWCELHDGLGRAIVLLPRALDVRRVAPVHAVVEVVGFAAGILEDRKRRVHDPHHGRVFDGTEIGRTIDADQDRRVSDERDRRRIHVELFGGDLFFVRKL